MAKDQTKTVEFKEVIEEASSASGAPKKQLEESAAAIHNAIQTCLTKHQPKRDGDSVEVMTPFCVVKSTRLPEQIVTDASGNQVKRPACCAVNYGVRREYVLAANVGLVDSASLEDTGSSGKKAKSA